MIPVLKGILRENLRNTREIGYLLIYLLWQDGRMNLSASTKESPVSIQGQAGRIEALINTPVSGAWESRSPLFGIFCHPHPLHGGTMQNKVVTTAIKAWATLGLATLRFNFRGVGESEGEYSEGKGELEDLKSVINWVLQAHPNARFWLGGFSFGSAISATLAVQSNYPVQALLSIAPPITFFSFSEVPNVSLQIPWIIIQGDKDEIVSYDTVVSFVDRIKKTKSDIELVTFKGGDHFFHGRLNELKEEIIQHMRPLL